MKEGISVGFKELEIIKTLNLVKENKLTQATAAKRLNISERQVRNLLMILLILRRHRLLPYSQCLKGQ